MNRQLKRGMVTPNFYFPDKIPQKTKRLAKRGFRPKFGFTPRLKFRLRQLFPFRGRRTSSKESGHYPAGLLGPQEKRPKFSAGFTTIEIVVILAIISVISTLVLVSFTGLNEGGAVNRSARELALALRRAQNMSLAVTQVPTSAGLRNAPAVGLKLDRNNPNSYFLFADLLQDGKYSAADDAKIGADEVFPRGIKINLITGGSGVSFPVAHIIFAAPEATVTLSDGSGTTIGNVIEVEIITASGLQKKTVTARTSGQISIR